MIIDIKNRLTKVGEVKKDAIFGNNKVLRGTDVFRLSPFNDLYIIPYSNTIGYLDYVISDEILNIIIE